MNLRPPIKHKIIQTNYDYKKNQCDKLSDIAYWILSSQIRPITMMWVGFLGFCTRDFPHICYTIPEIYKIRVNYLALVRSKINLQEIVFLILENYPDLFIKTDYKHHLEGSFRELLVIISEELIWENNIAKQNGFQITKKGKEIIRIADRVFNPNELELRGNFP